MSAWDTMVSSTGTSPEWFRRGVEAALLAPTAINQQKFSFLLQPQEENKSQKFSPRKDSPWLVIQNWTLA